MPVLKGDKGGLPGPIKPPSPFNDMNCMTCANLGRPGCPMPSEVARRMMQNSMEFRQCSLGDTPCGGDKHDATPVHASMRIAMSRANCIKSVRAFGTERMVEAGETVKE